MRQPNRYSALDIKQWDVSTKQKGIWIPARTVGHNMRGWAYRWKLAYLVLIGKYDALDWEDN